MKPLLTIAILILIVNVLYGQASKWDPAKPGTWRLENHLPDKSYKTRNITLSATDNIAFKQNISTLAEWFRQNNRMLKTPTGYDLRALVTWVWSDYSTIMDYDYAIPCEMGFLFELFYSDGSKWKVEPPQYNFDINATYGGIDGLFFTPESIVDDGSRYDQSFSGKVDKALNNLRQYFRVYPLKESPHPGVDIYQAYRDGWQQNGKQRIVVYNPERPPYWIPVTVSEMADAHLAYYSLFQKKEIDRMLLEQLKQEIAELTPEELAAPAYAGHNSHFVLQVNGTRQGYQIMRFNPAYWDRSLPPSAIQFMAFFNENLTEDEMADQEKRSYPNFPQLFVNEIKWDKIATLIMKKK